MTLPIAVSVPHAGLLVPASLRDKYLLTEEQTRLDGDVGAFQIYALQDKVACFARASLARAVLDLNRASDDQDRPDGVVKTHSCWDEPVWQAPLSEDEIARLITGFHEPYHRQLSSFAGQVQIGFDCHTMSDVGPPIGPDAGQRRPMVCLSDGDGTTCPPDWMAALHECFAREFDDVQVNTPFRGGYITRSHSSEMPWVQIELSRTNDLSIGEKRLGVHRALRDWCQLSLPSHRGTPIA